MEKQETIFRQKSIDKISSPEQLDSYLKVTSPSVWLVLVGIILILVGALAWGAFGKLNTYANVGCVVDSNVAYCYAKEDDASKIKVGMNIEIPNEEVTINISQIENTGMIISDDYDYLQHLIGVTSSDYVFAMAGVCNLKSGYYQGRVIIETISPLKFIFN